MKMMPVKYRKQTYEVLLDDEDHEKLRVFLAERVVTNRPGPKQGMSSRKRVLTYAPAWKGRGFRPAIWSDGKLVYLARWLMGVSGPGFAHIIVDHLDQNPLNNTRGNLRLVGRRENAMNSGKCGWDRKTLSGFRGVSRSKASLKSPWFGWVMLPSGRRTSRSFATPEEAAKWRDIKIRETYGMATTVNREDWLPKHLRRKP